MKKFLSAMGEQLTNFINSKKIDEQAASKSETVLRNIDLAIRKQAGVHVIFADKSFTGDIIKYDQERGQLVVKNFRKSMSTIIRVADIKRISLVPNEVRKSQILD
ncbi:hypothetical protein STRDD10_01514 [Streptococcus sp. DD10]|uniref:hypothetical protein n=1 Tax=Streptococcus sp. DD10 TaxID=1777878 RepID=UPI000799BA96|nr:hypothetical protein [Streptococcus sp. DD10]KXT73432.1 hypothetical protein STRDD10_01514 [Streptococcus sp. DD10]